MNLNRSCSKTITNNLYLNNQYGISGKPRQRL